MKALGPKWATNQSLHIMDDRSIIRLCVLSSAMLLPVLKLKYPLKYASLCLPASINRFLSLFSLRDVPCSLGASLGLVRAREVPLWSKGSLTWASGWKQEPSWFWVIALHKYEWMKFAWYCIFCIIHQEGNLAQAPAVMRKISFLGWSLHWQPVISLLAGRVGVVLQGLLNFSRCLEVAVPAESTTFGALCALPKWNLLQTWDWDWQGVGEQLWCSSKAKCCPFCIICKNMLSGREIQLALCHLPPPQRVLQERV